MKRPVTIRGIAALAGVSPAAVSYVLSGKSRSKRIPETTERRIIDLAESLGWMPNHVLSSFATGKTKLVGLWQTSLREPYHTWVTQATEQILREAGYAMILSSAHVKEPGMEYDLSLFNQWSVDGLFGLGGIKWISRFFEINPHWRLPMVSFGNHVLRDNPNVDSVYVDVLKPVRTGLEAWFEQGYRRIAMLSGHDSTNDVYEREQVYMSFVHRHRLKPELISFPKQESQRKSAETTLRRHILQHGCPQALFCRSDEVMIGASKTLQEPFPLPAFVPPIQHRLRIEIFN